MNRSPVGRPAASPPHPPVTASPPAAESWPTPPSPPASAAAATAGQARPRAPEVWAAGAEFADAELQSLVSAGALHHLLGRVYAPADRPVDPALRAQAVWLVAGPVLTAGWTAMGLTAAWLHAGGPLPRMLHIAVAHYHRPPPARDHGPGWAFTQADVAAVGEAAAPAEQDVVRIGPVRVTTVGRTVEDLLLAEDAQKGRAAARLIARFGSDGLAERLAPPRRRPGIVRARRRLAELLG